MSFPLTRENDEAHMRSSGKKCQTVDDILLSTGKNENSTL